MNPKFKRFLRLAIGGRRIGDRCNLFRQYLKANCAKAHPEYSDEQLIGFAEQAFIDCQDNPPAAEHLRPRLAAFKAEQRAQRRRERAQKAANARWQKKDLEKS
jgi:hypothetical protein